MNDKTLLRLSLDGSVGRSVIARPRQPRSGAGQRPVMGRCLSSADHNTHVRFGSFGECPSGNSRMVVSGRIQKRGNANVHAPATTRRLKNPVTGHGRKA